MYTCNKSKSLFFFFLSFLDGWLISSSYPIIDSFLLVRHFQPRISIERERDRLLDILSQVKLATIQKGKKKKTTDFDLFYYFFFFEGIYNKSDTSHDSSTNNNSSLVVVFFVCKGIEPPAIKQRHTFNCMAKSSTFLLYYFFSFFLSLFHRCAVNVFLLPVVMSYVLDSLSGSKYFSKGRARATGDRGAPAAHHQS